MRVFGINLHKPTFWGVTRATAVAVALWGAIQASPLASNDSGRAASLLAALLFGCLSNEVGINVAKGGRHLLLNIAGCALVVLGWRLIASII